MKSRVIIVASRTVTEGVGNIAKEEEKNGTKEGKRDNELLKGLFKGKEVGAVADHEKDGEFIEKIGVNGRERIK